MSPSAVTFASVRQQLLRDLVTAEMGLVGAEGSHGELLYAREWRGRRHEIQVKFGKLEHTIYVYEIGHTK